MKVGAAWIKKNEKGEVYMSINVDMPFLKDNFIMVKNKDKKKDSEPDYLIMWSPFKKTTKKTDEEIPF